MEKSLNEKSPPLTGINEGANTKHHSDKISEKASKVKPPAPEALVLDTDHENSFTCLTCAQRLLLTKRVRADGKIEGYDNAATFKAQVVDVGSLDAVERLLLKLEKQPHSALVAGAILPTANRCGMARRTHEKRLKDGTIEPATLKDVPRRLCILDLDAVECPPGLDRANLEAAADFARKTLPDGFKLAECVALATSSYMVKSGLRFRIFFRLSRAITYADQKRWLTELGVKADFAPMHAAGLNYTAAPIFDSPQMNPLPNGRVVRLGGSAVVQVPKVITSGEKVRKGKTCKQRPSDGLVERIRAALAFLDHDNREEWLHVGMMLHEEGDEYFPIWNEWSQKSAEKYVDGECEDKWNGFTRGMDGGLTVDTLFHRAREKGWKDDLNEAVAHDGGVLTQDGVALTFADNYAGRLRYCHTTGAWFEWDGARWSRDGKERAFQYARQLGRKLTNNEKDGVKKEVRKVAFARGVEKFSQSAEVFATNADDWNRDPLLLGTPSGTVDLRTGALRPANPVDMITRRTTVSPAGTEDCPRWLKFLKETFGDNENLIGFIRRWFGYCLTGDVSEHALLFGWGEGGNGKGVLVNTLKEIMGDYALAAPIEMFLSQPFHGHPTELARLDGARMVVSQEVEPDQQWSQTRITSLTGGDIISARFMRQDWFDYKPQFKLTFVGNNKPGLKTVNDAIRRRFNLVPFRNKPREVDQTLNEKLREEYPGILRWMINGCLEWQEKRLDPPEEVNAVTEAYLAGEDRLAAWLEETCVVSEETSEEINKNVEFIEPKTPRSQLFASWRKWSNECRRDAGIAANFYTALESRGFQEVKIRGTRYFKRIKLVANEPYKNDPGGII